MPLFRAGATRRVKPSSKFILLGPQIKWVDPCNACQDTPRIVVPLDLHASELTQTRWGKLHDSREDKISRYSDEEKRHNLDLTTW